MPQKPLLTLLVHEKHPRILYACELLFSCILGWDYECLFPEEFVAAEGLVLNYTGQEMVGIPAIFYAKDWVKQKYFPAKTIRVKGEGESLELFLSPRQSEMDFLAAAFYLASFAEKYAETHYDTHERYAELAYPSHQYNLYQKPYLHIFAQKIAALFPHVPTKKHIYKRLLTWDIDAPWHFLHKPFPINLAAWAKDIFQLRGVYLKDRIQAHLSGKDPFFTFETILANCKPEETIFFFLIERSSDKDTRYTWRHTRTRKLIQDLQATGYSIGIHPSYNTFLNPQQIRWEVQKLAEITGQAVLQSRQHYLRYRYPDTFRALLAAGIRHDYSHCLYHNVGFMGGMCLPFPWYDYEAEFQTDLYLHPTQVMDRTLQQYLNLSPQEAFSQVRKIEAQTQQYGGEFVLLFHNDMLSNVYEWQGWAAEWLKYRKEG